MQFSRFAETIQIKSDKHVADVTVTLKLSDCTGTIYFTDLQLQEGDQLTGYTVNTSKMLTKMQENGQPVPPRHYNGVVRTAETVILFNLGKTSAGLDCYIYPIQNMEAGSLELSQACPHRRHLGRGVSGVFGKQQCRGNSHENGEYIAGL